MVGFFDLWQNTFFFLAFNSNLSLLSLMIFFCPFCRIFSLYTRILQHCNFIIIIIYLCVCGGGGIGEQNMLDEAYFAWELKSCGGGGLIPKDAMDLASINLLLSFSICRLHTRSSTTE